MTGNMRIANAKSRWSDKQNTSHQISATNWNITNNRNGMPWMGYSQHNEISMHGWESYSPGAWYINTMAWLPMTSPNNMMNPFNTGYQQYCPNIQDAEESVIRTPFSAKNWIRLANSESDYPSKAVPYNSTVLWDHCLGYYPTHLVCPGMLTDFPGVAQWKSNRWFGDQNQVALNRNPWPQGVRFSDCQFEDELTHMVVSSTGERKLKNDRPPFLKQEKLPLVKTCPENSIPKTWGGLPKANPNPNGRGRSASVISEVSSTTSSESKRAELFPDSMMLRTPCEHTPSVKTMEMTSTPTSQRSLSDKTSVSDFVLKSDGLSVSNCEVRESLHQTLVISHELSPKLLSKSLVSKSTQLPLSERSLKSITPLQPPVPLSELSSKAEELKPLSFNVESASRKEDDWHVVSPQKKRKNYESVTVKLYKPSSAQVLEIPEPHTSPRARKKSQKLKEIKNKRKPNKELKEECGPYKYSKNQVTTQKKRQSTCDIFKDYLIRVIMA